MLCFRDRTFCPFYSECKHGDKCKCALTPEIRKEAAEWWGSEDAPIAVYGEKPHCFEAMDNEVG